MADRKEYLSEDKVARFLDRNLWLRLVSLAKGHKSTALTAFFFLITSELLPVLQPRVLQRMIDGPIKHKDLAGIAPYMTAFVALVLVSGAFEYFRAVASQKLGLFIIHELRVRIFARLQGFSMDFFHRTPVGRLMTRLGNDIDSLSGMFTEGLIELLGALLMIAYAVGFMLWLDWRLALASLAVLPLMILTTSIFREKVRQNNTVIRGLLAELNSIMQESLAGIHIVRIFGRVAEQVRKFDEVNRRTRVEWFKNVKYYSVFFPVISGLTELSLAILYFAGAWLFFRGSVSIGTLVAFSWYTGLFFRPLRELSDKITALQSALAAAERVFTLFDTEAALPSGSRVDFPDRPTLRFENVSFGYDPGKPVLKEVSFVVEPGESVAIVGATGSGKSTTISLCNKFYLPDSGSISVGGRSIVEFEDRALRKHISLISQDVYLFSETVAFNVALGPDFDLARVEEVCRYVNAHDFIARMPDGYRTRLKERGENLSAGQRQLLAFARALYHRPKILLLDEATSSVDTATEGLVQEALEKILRDMTSIVVAHRLSTIQKATRILVMHKGRIREQGTHQELLRLGGIYHKLYQLQDFDGSAEPKLEDIRAAANKSGASETRPA
ncbi:MAG: ABC transporter ATP-binding protein [Fibrobacteres bacterium]|jgi:ATP-binding cassette subfamily B multidrug efflux pump|nr:ABC transporter ATP-binding protein [Fibrobacterota bacterium]